ncbi:MAG TPA: hypothetical protein VF107_14255 [Burkholderiaceae bacterium]
MDDRIDRRRALGFVAASGTPLGAFAQSEVQAVFTNAGGRPLALKADESRAALARDLQRWVPLVRVAGLKAD